MNNLNNIKINEKRLINGGIYWINYSDFKIPEWGNSSTGPHPGIIIKISKFHDNEMLLCFPLTTKQYLLNSETDQLFQFKMNNKLNFVLFSQVRSIAAWRILTVPNNLGDDLVLGILDEKSLKKLLIKYSKYLQHWFENAFLDSFFHEQNILNNQIIDNDYSEFSGIEALNNLMQTNYFEY